MCLLFITDGEGRGGADSRKSDGGHAWYWTQHRGIPLQLLRDAPIVPVLPTCCTQFSAPEHSSQTSSWCSYSPCTPYLLYVPSTQHRGIPLKLLRDAPVVPVLPTCCTQYSAQEYELCTGNISCGWKPSFIYLQYSRYWFLKILSSQKRGGSRGVTLEPFWRPTPSQIFFRHT